jgi:hypothetical protein
VQADESDRATSNNSSAVVTTVSESSQPPPGGTTTPQAPKYQGEQRLYTGKGTRRKLIGFQLRFSGALDLASARSRSHYQLTQPGRTKRSAPIVVPLKSIDVSANGLEVTLTPGKYNTRKPLKLTIAGLIGSLGQKVATIAITV